MRRYLHRQIVLVVCLTLLTGCFGSITERLETLADGPTVVWIPAVIQAPPVQAQPAGHLDLVAQVGGRMQGIAVAGNYAYVGVGPRLIVLDLSEPSQPVAVGQTGILPDLVSDVAVVDQIAYVTTEAGEQLVIDVADATAPRDVTATSAQVAAQTAVMGVLGGQSIHDTTVVNGYAYVAVDQGVRVVDVAGNQPAAVVASVDLPYAAQELTALDDRVYVAAGQSGLAILDVSNPAQPVEVGSYNALEDVVDVQVAGGVAYLVDPWSGLHLVDVREPGALRELGGFDTPGLTSDVFVAGQRAYVIDPWFGLYIVDVQVASAPALQGVYALPQNVQSVVTLDNQVAYVAAQADGLWVVNLADPTAPLAVKRVALPEISGGLAVADGYLYVTGESGLRIYSLANPLDPQEVSVYNDLSYAGPVAAAGQFAYVAADWSVLQIIDVSNPAQPTPVAAMEIGLIRDIKVVGNALYVAAEEAGLYVIDISNPSSPRLDAANEFAGDAMGVSVNGDHTYLAAGGAGLQVVMFTPASAPTTIGKWTEKYGRDVLASGAYAYLASEQSGLQVLDVSEPTTPVLAETINTLGTVTDIQGSDGYLYVADGDGGLLVFRIQSQPQ